MRASFVRNYTRAACGAGKGKRTPAGMPRKGRSLEKAGLGADAAAHGAKLPQGRPPPFRGQPRPLRDPHNGGGGAVGLRDSGRTEGPRPLRDPHRGGGGTVGL